MPQKKRYIATVSFYVYAETDEKAKEIVRSIQEKERKQYDNYYDVQCLEEQPFASFKRRKINL